MRWYRDLTRRQRSVVVGLTIAVIAVIAALGWSVWMTLQASATLSPVSTPDSDISPVSTPTPPSPPSPTPVPTPSSTPTAPFEVSQAGLIAMEIAEARDSRTRWRTPVTLVDDHRLSVALYRRYQNWPPLPIQTRPLLEALNLWYWDDVRLDVIAHAQNTAALYIPELEELYVRRDWDGPSEIQEMQVAYGYARAQPDQYGDLLSLSSDASSIDRQIALSAVADGDALMAVWLFAGAAPGSRQAEKIERYVETAVLPLWQREDPLLNDLSGLAFSLGKDFAVERFESGGTEALDQAIIRPPRSTEQLLHPERYAAGDEPVPILPHEIDLGRRWILTQTETLGEALMGLAMVEWSNGELSPDVVEGWGGDRLQVWQHEDGSTVAMWQAVWDTTPDAYRYYHALQGLMPSPLVRGFASERTMPDSLPSGRWWVGTRGAVFLHRHGDRTWLLWGEDPEVVEEVGAVIERPEGATSGFE